MADMRTIEIDFEVHKLIENERRSFDESPNDALRRLVGLKEVISLPIQSDRVLVAAKRPWRDHGVTLPHGTEIRMKYNKYVYNSRIVDGKWIMGEKAFESPSGAASGVGVTKNGKITRLNGRKYWEVRKPGEDAWTLLDNLYPNSTDLTLDDLGL